MHTPREPQPSDAVSYYTECWVARLREGHNAASHAIHYGLDGSADRDAQSAKLDLNAHVADRIGLAPERHARLLDLGCGVGGTMIDLARRYGSWSFCGVDRTPASIAFGSELVREARLTDRIELVEADYGDTRLDTTFDGAYAIESACHCFDRPRMAKEVLRLLKPGAALVVADLFRTPMPLDEEAAEQYRVLKAGFCVADYYDADLAELFVATGFSSVDVADLGSRVRDAIVQSAGRARRTLAGGVRSPLMRAHLQACLAVERLDASGHLGYRSIRGIRP